MNAAEPLEQTEAWFDETVRSFIETMPKTFTGRYQARRELYWRRRLRTACERVDVVVRPEGR